MTHNRGMLLLLFLLFSIMVGPLLGDADETELEGCAPLNLADLGGELYVSVRHYPGVNPDDFTTITDRTAIGFLPIIRESPGFVLYALAHILPDQTLAVNVFRSEAAMQASNAMAADFVSEHLAPLLPEAPQISAGDVTVLALPGHCDDMLVEEGDARSDEKDDMDDMDDMQVINDMEPLFVSLRHYSAVDPADVPEIARIVEEQFVAVISESPGFRFYLNLTAGDEVYGSLNIFETEEEMDASNEKAAEFVAAQLAELLPQAPTITAGDISIFHVADKEALMEMGDDDEDMEQEGA